MEFNPNPNSKVISVDMDGTLTNGEPFWKQEPTPNLAVIEKVRSLYREGNIIIVWSARQWEIAQEMVAWLIKYHVPFHGLMCGKGGSDVYIDDKAINTKDFLERGVPKSG